MSANGSKSARVRAKLNHPIIDTDGHTVEFTPVFFDYIKEFGGAGMIERYKKAVGNALTTAGRNYPTKNGATRAPHARPGGRGRPRTRWIERPHRCRTCCTNAWMSWAWISPCSTPLSA